MKNKSFLWAFLAVFAFIFVFEWIFHGICLKETYERTAHLWRDPESMHNFMPFMTIGQVLFSFMFCLIFTKGYQKKGVWEGLRYGVLIALLLSTITFVEYSVIPYPASLIRNWIFGSFIELGLAGMILAAIYKK